jgi:hypothetical protein
MTPTAPTPDDRAAELDIAAKIARELGDYVFAKECESWAENLRMQEKK